MVRKAKYVSEWNEGIQIKTNCMVDTESKEVFNIEMTSFFLKILYISTENTFCLIIRNILYST